MPDGNEWSECFSKLVGGADGKLGFARCAMEKKSCRVIESPMKTTRLDFRHLSISLESYWCIMQSIKDALKGFFAFGSQNG